MFSINSFLSDPIAFSPWSVSLVQPTIIMLCSSLHALAKDLMDMSVINELSIERRQYK